MNDQQFVISPDAVETIVTDWTTAKIMCDPHISRVQGMGAVDLVFEPGQGHFRHNHTDAEQIIYVISGHGTHTSELPDGTSVVEKVSAGSLIFIPKGVYHSTMNAGWEPMRVLAVFSPPSPVIALRELGDTGGVGTAQLKIFPAGESPGRK